MLKIKKKKKQFFWVLEAKSWLAFKNRW